MTPARPAGTPRSNPVLLHGFTGSSAAWGDRIVDGLASAGMDPVLVDLPGHGRMAGARDPGQYTLESALEVVEDAGLWPADLVGYSMGGRVALHFAARHPEKVRRLVLESASPGLATEEERAARCVADETLARRIEAEGVEAFIGEWERLPLFESEARVDPGLRARRRAIRLANEAGGLARALRGIGTGALPSLWDELRRIGVPTLVLVGEHDGKFVEIGRRMADGLPAGRLHIAQDAGHCVHFEHPGAWLDAVGGFLTEGERQ